MKKSLKALSKVLVFALCVSLALTGCGKIDSPAPETTASAKTEATQAAETASAPKLDEVTLIAYLLGEAPQHGPAVMEEVNKKLKNDINATLQLEYIAFGDISTKYPLVLAAGGDWDVIYGNIDYAANATKGGYHEITMADIEKYAPLTFKAATKEQWADTLVNGKIYMLPQTFKELDVAGLFYREDLRKKFSVPEIKTALDLEAYFVALKKNGITPLDGTSDDITGLFGAIQTAKYGYTRQKAAGTDIACYSADDTTGKMVGILDDEYMTSFKEAATTMKKFFDSGLIPKNVFAQKTVARDMFKEEKTAAWINAFENYPQYESDVKAKGWELGFLPFVSDKGTALIRPAIGNGWAFSPSSKNFERALMAMDLISQDQAYNMLVSFGIEGTDYVMQDGKLAPAPGIDVTKHPYPMYGAGFWSSNRDQWPPLVNYSQGYLDAKQKLKDAAKSNIMNGFNPVDDSIKTELANCANVRKQYGLPIQFGMVKDIDAAIKIYVDKTKAAGGQKILDEYRKQAEEFVKAHTN